MQKKWWGRKQNPKFKPSESIKETSSPEEKPSNYYKRPTLSRMHAPRTPSNHAYDAIVPRKKKRRQIEGKKRDWWPKYPGKKLMPEETPSNQPHRNDRHGRGRRSQINRNYRADGREETASTTIEERLMERWRGGYLVGRWTYRLFL